jgi:hypothetical protein
MAAAGTLLSDLDGSGSVGDGDLVQKILSDMNSPTDGGMRQIPPAMPQMNSPQQYEQMANSMQNITMDSQVPTSHMIGTEHPTPADFKAAMVGISSSTPNIGQMAAPVSPPLSSPMPGVSTSYEAPSKNMYGYIVKEIKTPFIVAIIFFVFSLPPIRVLAAHYMPSLIKATGEFHLLGLLVISLIAGLTFWILQRVIASLVFFAFYFIYGIIRFPFVQYLVSISVGAIIYGITDSYELTAIGLLLAHFMFMTRKSGPKKEGFANPLDISKRITGMKSVLVSGITGVGSPLSEGFEDAASTDLTLSKEKKETPNTENATASSKPAEVKAVEEPTGLFKLGEIPKDVKGGLHIDAGTTVMNALNSLKPDQIEAMTKDTKQLIETQKSLMGMLQTIAPMVNEGKQMMDTFNDMFGPAMAKAAK